MTGENGQVLPCVTGVVGGATCVSVLPNTGGWMVLQYIALTAIVIGGFGLLSIVARAVAKRAYKA